MAKLQINVDVGNPDEIAAFAGWLERWRTRATVSENKGCGCCVNIWDIDTPREALDELPEVLRGADPSD
jgi:hypothetical protein